MLLVGLSSVVKNPPANAGDTRDAGSIPGSGRYPGEGNGNPPQSSCLGNHVDRGAWWTTVCGVTRVGHDLVTKQPQVKNGRKKWNKAVRRCSVRFLAKMKKRKRET